MSRLSGLSRTVNCEPSTVNADPAPRDRLGGGGGVETTCPPPRGATPIPVGARISTSAPLPPKHGPDGDLAFFAPPAGLLQGQRHPRQVLCGRGRCGRPHCTPPIGTGR